jgi:hypothetical protein
MSQAVEPPFEPGRVVVYKSGGGRMTVVRCVPTAHVPRPWNGATDSIDSWDGDWGVKVAWVQDDGVPHDRFIEPGLIEIYRSDFEKAHDAAMRVIEQRRQQESN